MKYKVGDKVTVRKDIKTKNFITPFMEAMGGKIMTIEFVDTTVYHVAENQWAWNDDMLEPLTEGAFPSFTEIVEKAGIKKGDRVLISGHELTYTGEAFVDKSGKRTNTKILGQDFKILPKPKTGAEILAHLKELRGDWEPDWNDDDELKCDFSYFHSENEWYHVRAGAVENLGTLFFSEKTVGKAKDYLNTLTEEESLNLLKEMRI